MKTSESIVKISAALVKMQAETSHATFDSLNPHFKNKYASLAEVIDTVKPVLAKYGLCVLQLPFYREGIGFMLSTRILHESGEWIETEVMLNPTKNDPQGVGSAITYMRRYTIPGVCLIASDEDDDGNEASKPNSSKDTSVKVDYAAFEKKIDDELSQAKDADKVRELFRRYMADMGVNKNNPKYSYFSSKFSAKAVELSASKEQASQAS